MVGQDVVGNSPLDQAADLELIQRCKTGDSAAFDELMRRYAQSIYRLVYRMARNHADADDLSQETFIRAWRAIGRFDEQYRFYTWLHRIAVNLCMTHLKKRNRLKLSPLPGVDGGNEELDIEDKRSGAEGSSLRRDLDQAIVKLPVDQRAVFVLRVKDEMSYAEISETLGIPVGTVMSRLNRARGRLKVLLKDYLSA